jgi:hypothetical protein
MQDFAGESNEVATLIEKIKQQARLSVDELSQARDDARIARLEADSMASIVAEPKEQKPITLIRAELTKPLANASERRVKELESLKSLKSRIETHLERALQAQSLIPAAPIASPARTPEETAEAARAAEEEPERAAELARAAARTEIEAAIKAVGASEIVTEEELKASSKAEKDGQPNVASEIAADKDGQPSATPSKPNRGNRFSPLDMITPVGGGKTLRKRMVKNKTRNKLNRKTRKR